VTQTDRVQGSVEEAADINGGDDVRPAAAARPPVRVRGLYDSRPPGGTGGGGGPNHDRGDRLESGAGGGGYGGLQWNGLALDSRSKLRSTAITCYFTFQI